MLLIRPRTIFFAVGLLAILIGIQTMFTEFLGNSRRVRTDLQQTQTKIEQIAQGGAGPDAAAIDTGAVSTGVGDASRNSESTAEPPDSRSAASSASNSDGGRGEPEQRLFVERTNHFLPFLAARPALEFWILFFAGLTALVLSFRTTQTWLVLVFAMASVRTVYLIDPFSPDLENSFTYLSVGGGICLMSVLWNVSSLSRDWLTAVGFAFKGLGALLILLVGQWFQLQTSEKNLVQAEKDLAEKRAQRFAEEVKNEKDRIERLTDTFVERFMKSGNDFEKLLLVNSVYPHIMELDTVSATLLQILHGIALAKEDEEMSDEVRSHIRKLLFPSVHDVDYPEDPLFYIAMELRLDTMLRQKSEIPRGEYDLIRKERWMITSYNRCYEKARTKNSHLDAKLVTIAQRLEELSDFLATRITETARISPYVPEAPILPPYPGEVPRLPYAGGLLPPPEGSMREILGNVGQRAPAMVTVGESQQIDLGSVETVSMIVSATATQSARSTPAKTLLRKLDQGNETVIEQAVNLLPDYTIGRVPARIYLHLPKELSENIGGYGQLKSELAKRTEYIIPKFTIIEDVGGNVPDVTSVRYYRAEDGSAPDEAVAVAEFISKEFLPLFGINDSQTYGITPTEADRRISRNLNNKFEIWFAKNAKPVFSRPEPSEKDPE